MPLFPVEKHIDILQATIARMAANSFLLKGWSVTLVTALIALSGTDANLGFSALALLPSVMFWALDAYFVSLERRFRALYDRVRTQEAPVSDLSMDIGPFNAGPNTLLASLTSASVLAFHLPVLVAAIAVLALAL